MKSYKARGWGMENWRIQFLWQVRISLFRNGWIIKMFSVGKIKRNWMFENDHLNVNCYLNNLPHFDIWVTRHTNATARLLSEHLTPWKALLIDQSALTAVWREPLTLWLQRVCVQWPCKGSLMPTLGVSTLWWKRWRAHVHKHVLQSTHTQAALLFLAKTPSRMHSHRAVSVYFQSGSGNTGSLFFICFCTGLAPRWASSVHPFLMHEFFCFFTIMLQCSQTINRTLHWYCSTKQHYGVLCRCNSYVCKYNDKVDVDCEETLQGASMYTQ